MNYVFIMISRIWEDILAIEGNSVNLFVIFFCEYITLCILSDSLISTHTLFKSLHSPLHAAGRMTSILNFILYLQILIHLSLLRTPWSRYTYYLILWMENQGMKGLISMLVELRFKTSFLVLECSFNYYNATFTHRFNLFWKYQ